MFRKIVLGIAVAAMIASPAFAGRYSSGSSSYRSSSSSFSSGSRYSSGSSFGSSSSSTPRFSSGSSYSAPAASTSRFSSGSSYNYKPAQTTVVPRTTYGGSYGGFGGYHPSTVNHYYGGGYGGGPFSSPWFWMWAMDRPHNQPVYINGSPAPMVAGQAGYASGAPAQDPIGYFFAIITQILILVLIIALVIWVVRKLFFKR